MQSVVYCAFCEREANGPYVFPGFSAMMCSECIAASYINVEFNKNNSQKYRIFLCIDEPNVKYYVTETRALTETYNIILLSNNSYKRAMNSVCARKLTKRAGG